MSFVHLHCHSEYSLLDGANRIDDLIRRAAEFEQPALAITDHGNLHAAWEFHEKAKKAKIKPIIGMEAYVAPGDRRARSRTAQNAKPYFHLVLLARDLTGYRNLIKLSSLAYVEGFYSRPRVDRELLERYNEGIIVSSACLAGEVAKHLMEDNPQAAREAASWYAEVFKDRYYLEVQAHDSGPQAELNRRVFALSTELGLPVIATNDAHFLRSDDHDAHDVLLCIGLGKDRSDPDRMRYDRGLYFKSAPEIAAFFPKRPDVAENTLRIADAVNVTYRRQYHVPSFPLPEAVADEPTLLRQLTFARATARYGTPLPDEIRTRLEYELGVISNPKTDYSGYLLITQDFINWAKDRGIPVGPGRGSSAGSLVAYVLGITDVDPLRFDLLFERFLNPDRVSMPDIDVDFCYERRGEVIEYVRSKYGKDSVGQIITFGTMAARAVIRDVGRAMNVPLAVVDGIAKKIPAGPGVELKEALEQDPDLRAQAASDPQLKELFDVSLRLEGLNRHASTHAAGVVIGDAPLMELVPLYKNGEEITTQYSMEDLEACGLLKMDFLGLRNLTVIDRAVGMIERSRVSKIDIRALPL